MAFLFVVDVVALVLAAIRPLEHAWALHFVVPPHSFVLSTVRPVVNTYMFKYQLSAAIFNTNKNAVSQ